MHELDTAGASEGASRRQIGSATVTVREAASVLGISRSSAYELVRIGTIPSLRLGHRLVIPRRALMAMIDGPTNDAG